jgi:hypothetical protein
MSASLSGGSPEPRDSANDDDHDAERAAVEVVQHLTEMERHRRAAAGLFGKRGLTRDDLNRASRRLGAPPVDDDVMVVVVRSLHDPAL